jgi:hypothetical protein
MEPIDAHYTPTDLAGDLVGAGAQYFQTPPNLVADFAAGQGGLLDAAACRWRDARIVANDAHRATYLRLRRERPTWAVANADFVSERSIGRSRLLSLRNSVDLALLNPPFSQKRGDLYVASIDGVRVECGLAAAFLVNSLPFMRVGGTITSIVPDGCMTADRDRAAWRLLMDRCEVRIEVRNRRGIFSNASPNTSIVTLTKRASPRPPAKSQTQPSFASVAVVRGWQQMHTISASDRSCDRIPLIHTTELKAGRVALSQSRLVNSRFYFQGPALLLPRVGRMTEEKVCVLASRRKVVLSDCVIGIPMRSLAACQAAQRRMLSAWLEVSRCYSGTGAPYTTVATIGSLLSELGIVDERLG